MGSSCCTHETERLAREIEAEAARIERYCDYVKTSLDHEPDSIGADFREIVDSCREIDVMMVQLPVWQGRVAAEAAAKKAIHGK